MVVPLSWCRRRVSLGDFPEETFCEVDFKSVVDGSCFFLSLWLGVLGGGETLMDIPNSEAISLSLVAESPQEGA